jgi:hypothetical protein
VSHECLLCVLQWWTKHSGFFPLLLPQPKVVCPGCLCVLCFLDARVSGGVFWVFYTYVWHFSVTAVRFSKNDHNSVLQGKNEKIVIFFFPGV